MVLADEINRAPPKIQAALLEAMGEKQVSIGVDPEIRAYLVDVCRATIASRDYVAPEDVHAVVHPVLDHRIVLTTEADVRDVDPRLIVEGALNSVPVPSMED